MNFSKWFRGLRFKLFMMVLAPIMMFGVFGFIAISNFTNLEEKLEKQGMVTLPLSQYSGHMQVSINGMFRALWGMVANHSDLESKKFFHDLFTKSYQSFKASLEEVNKLPRSDFAKEKWKTFDSNWPALESHLLEIDALLMKNSEGSEVQAKQLLLNSARPLAVTIEKMFDEISQYRLERSSTEAHEAVSAAETGKKLIWGLLIFGSIALCVFGFGIASVVGNGLTRITESVFQTSHELATASEQLSSSSTELSSGAQEQAAAIEETSSSLEEISGMVQSNTKGAEESVRLAEDVLSVVQSGNESMSEIDSSMSEILASNERIEKLVKLIEEIGEKTQLIDEIVFQTRLLSFNASVEAERAGEHGRGFAVVAQEVGNLAQMSGKSAVEISSIVKNSVKEAQEIAVSNRAKVEKGADLVRSTSEQFQDVIKASEKILESARQILRASEEQNTGIRQINQSVDAINKSTQENAAAAEETAGGSESLRAQGEKLQALVSELSRIVEGGASLDMNNNPVMIPKNQFHAPSANVYNFKDKQNIAKPRLKNAAGSGFQISNGGFSADDQWEKI